MDFGGGRGRGGAEGEGTGSVYAAVMGRGERRKAPGRGAFLLASGPGGGALTA